MTPYETRVKVRAYRFNNSRFSPEETSELERYAKLYGIPFGKQGVDLTEDARSGILSQFSSGFTEGVLGPLAMGGWSEEPQTEFESIVHSAGHLLGFALPMAGSLLTGGGSAIARLGLSGVAGTGKIAKGLQATGKGLQTVGSVARGQQKVGGIQVKSVPLAVADWTTDKAKTIMAKAGFEAGNYLTKGKAVTHKAKMIDMAFQAQHLSVASAVSGLWNGQDDEVDNLIFGAVAGGFFGGLGNFVRIGNMIQHPNKVVRDAGKRSLWQHSKEFSDTLWDKRGQILRGVLGAGFQGGMATAQGAPTATQLYEYGLGAFFGYGAHGVVEKKATEFFNRYNERKDDGTLVRDFTELRKMLKSEEFKELPIESQQYVREAYNNHIGDHWERFEKANPSIELARAVVDSYNIALRKKSEELGKKIKDLQPHEIAETRAEILDVVPRSYLAQTQMSGISNEIVRQIRDPKIELQGDVKKITDKLTPQELKEVKEGYVDVLEKKIKEHFENLPKEQLEVTAQDILKAEETVLSDQPEVMVEPVIKRFLNQLQKETEGIYDGNKVLEHAVKTYNDLIPKTEAGEKSTRFIPVQGMVKEYTQVLKNKFPGIRVTSEMENSLTQMYTRMSQGILRPVISFNKTEKKTSRIWGFNALKKKITGHEPRSADEKIHEKLWGEDITVREFGELVDKKGNTYITLKPYDKVYNKKSKSYEMVMAKEDWLSITRGLDKRGEYLKIPKKDNGVERIYKYHPETGKTELSTIVSEVVKAVKDPKITKDLLNKYIEKDFTVWLKTMGYDPVKDKVQIEKNNLRNLYNKAFKSNYLYEKKWNFKDAVARVKREALLTSNSFYEQDVKFFKDITKGTGEINIIAIEAEANLLSKVNEKGKKVKQWFNVEGKKPETFWTVDKNGKVIEQAWESKIDGWLVMHSDLYKRFMEANGFKDVEMSHMKPAVAITMPDGSLFLIKGGVHPGSKAYNDAMPSKNSMIVVTSAIKSMPEGTKVYRGQAKKNGKYEIENYDGPSLKMSVEDFRISFGVYGDKHSAEPTTIKKQMHSFFDSLTMTKEGYHEFMDAIHHTAIHGSESANKYMNSLKENPDALPPKGFKVSELSDAHFVDVINNPNHKLHEALNKEIFKKLQKMEKAEEHEGVVYDQIKEYANNFERWYRATGYNPVSAIINNNLYEKSVHIYRMNKFTNPEWKNSGSGWVAGVDPVMEAITGGVKPNKKYEFFEDGNLVQRKVGHFKLGHSHSRMKIQWLGKDKEIELGEAWKQYKKEKDPFVKARMRNNLMFAVMRVPANAISGTRGLIFDGFSENNVGLADWGVYMRGRDHFYIDGADVDGDKVFFYQGLPDKYMKDLVAKDSFLEKKRGNKNIFFENKAEKLDKLFKSEVSQEDLNYVKKNPLSQWSPGALRKAGMSAYEGKKGLGLVVNAKAFLNQVIADVITNKNGKVNLGVYNNGKWIGNLEGKTSLKQLKADDGYYVIGTEAHSRTADSANYYSMATPQEMVNIVTQSAFEKLTFIPSNKKLSPRPATLTDLRKTLEYGHLHDLNQKLYGYDYANQRAFSISEIQQSTRPFQGQPKTISAIVDIAHKVSQNEMNIDPLRHFNYKTYRESIRLLSRQLLRDKDVLRYIARTNLRVMPLYYSIDYKAVHSVMKRYPEFVTVTGKKLQEVPEKGAKKADREPYRELLWEALEPPNKDGISPLELRLGKKGRDIQKAFNNMFSNKRWEAGLEDPKPIMRYSSRIEKEYKINDSYDVWSALQLLSKGKALDKALINAGHTVEKGNVPYERINEIANKIINGEQITGNNIQILENQKWSKQIQKAVDDIQAGKPPKTSPESKFLILRDIIARQAEAVKIQFNHSFKNENQRVFQTEKQANDYINKDVVEITKIAKEMKIKPEIALDYYYNYLLGSLRPQPVSLDGLIRNLNGRIATAEKRGQVDKVAILKAEKERAHSQYEKTSTPRFIWSMDAIPDRVKAQFMKGYADTFDLLNTVSPEKIRKETMDYLSKDKKDTKIGEIDSNIDGERIAEVEIDRLFKPTEMGELTAGKETVPSEAIPKDIPQVLKGITQSLKTLPDGATLRFEDLYTFMKAQQGAGPTSIKMATWDDIRNFNRFLKDIVSSTNPSGNVKKIYNFLFPDTIGKKQAGHDLDLLFKMKTPVRNAKDMGLATIKVPLSSMSFIQKVGGQMRELEDSIKNSMVESLFTGISVKSELEAIPNGIQTFTDLFMFAQKNMNRNRAWKPEDKAFYLKEWENSIDLYNSYKDKTFKITRNGKVIERKTDDLIKDIQEQQSEFFKNFYESYVGAGIVNTKGEFNKIDWNRVDANMEWASNGLVIHDFIRYDKNGRFDIENFQKKVMDNVETFGINALHKMIGNRDNPMSVELLNRVQYEIGLEEHIISKKFKPNSDDAKNVRVAWRKKNEFFGVGRIGSEGSSKEFVTEYFPQMMHDTKKLKPWIEEQQVRLKAKLENYVNDLTQGGKTVKEDSVYKIPKRYQFKEIELDALLNRMPYKDQVRIWGVGGRPLRQHLINLKLASQNADYQLFLGQRVESSLPQADYLVNFLNAEFRKGKEEWSDINAEFRPGTGRRRGDTHIPHFSYGFEVLEAYTNQWVGALFKNMNALTFRRVINNYEKNNVFAKENPEIGDMWVREMRKYASSLMGKPNALPTKYTGLTIAERAKLKQKIKQSPDGVQKKWDERKLKRDDDLKKLHGTKTSPWNPLQNLEYRLSDQNIVEYLDAKSQQLNKWAIPGISKKFHGTPEAPKLFGMELPTAEKARQQVLFQIVNNIGAYESKLSLVSLLAHPKTWLGNIVGGSQNTITNMGFRHFKRARDTKWLITNVFAGAKLKDGTPITDRNTIHRWVAEIGALESFYINEAMMDKRLDVKKLKPFIKEVFSKRDVNDATVRELAKKYQVTDSILSAGGFFMRSSERTLRTDAFIAHYLNARESLGQIIPNMPFDHPYLTGMALKGVEATQFLYHNVNRPAVSRSTMGKVFTRFQPFMWNSIRFRRDIFKQAKIYGFNDKKSMDRLKRLAMMDLTTFALAQVFVGSLFDSILPPPMSYIQDTADWIFGDEKERERAFFSAYPSPILAPLQVATAPINRYWMPLMTAMINGEWERWASYYTWTMFPFGRLARSTIMTLDRPEMTAEFMFGIPVHKLGSMIRESKKDEESI